jgi:hypothetical protein
MLAFWKIGHSFEGRERAVLAPTAEHARSVKNFITARRAGLGAGLGRAESDTPMLGFKRRARKRAAKEAAVLSALCAAVRTQLTDDLAEILASAIATPEVARLEADGYGLNAAAMQKGIDAVLVEGVDPLGPSLAGAERHLRAGAMLARAALNRAALGGSIHSAEIYDDFFRALRLPSESDAP